MNAALVKEYKIAVPPVEHGKVLVVKVGTDDRPATASDINQIMQVLKDAKDRPNATIVTHHCLDFVVIPKEALESIIVIGNFDVLGDKVSKD